MCLPFVWRNRGGKPRAQSLVLYVSLCLIGLLVKTIQSAFASGQLYFTLRVFLHCVLKSSISRISDEISVFHAWKCGRILVSCLLWTQSSFFFNLQLSHMFDPFSHNVGWSVGLKLFLKIYITREKSVSEVHKTTILLFICLIKSWFFQPAP